MTIPAEIIHDIASKCIMWEGEVLLTDRKEWQGLPWTIYNNKAYLLALEGKTIKLYQTYFIEIDGTNYIRLDEEPRCIKKWKDKMQFHSLMRKWGYK